MKLQGRDLTSGLRGEDVSLLQFELRQLGFSILDQEVARKFFGNTTLEADFRYLDGYQPVDERNVKCLSVGLPFRSSISLVSNYVDRVAARARLASYCD